MNTNKAAYWIALGVLALGLHSEYRHGNFVALHRVVEHADSTLCRIATRAERTLAVAKVLTSREGFPSDDLFVATREAQMPWDTTELLRNRDRDQARQEVRARAHAIRARAEMQRSEIEQIRRRPRPQLTLALTADPHVVVCPKAGARIVVNAEPESADVSPDVEVQDSF
jgi:hypothetical protein